MNLRRSLRKIILLLILTGCLLCGGCLPPKTIVAPLEPPQQPGPPETASQEKLSLEDQKRMEQLIQQLEETEQRLLETQRKTEEALKKIEKASQTTEESAERIEKAQEKIENIGQKDKP
jgi:hypothetical protein